MKGSIKNHLINFIFFGCMVCLAHFPNIYIGYLLGCYKEVFIMSTKMMGWTAVVVGILMGLTEFMGWSGSLNYLWALLVLIWGFMSFK